MSKLEQLLAINKLSQKDPKWIHKNIFRILNKDEIWIAAYERIRCINSGGIFRDNGWNVHRTVKKAEN